jgi:hypothetical protein
MEIFIVDKLVTRTGTSIIITVQEQLVIIDLCDIHIKQHKFIIIIIFPQFYSLEISY